MSKIYSYKDLIVWQKSREVVLLTYKATAGFPKDELYGLTSQIRRSAVSIPSNIAEGFRRGTRKEKLQFLRIAFGSGAELETQFDIAKDLNYINQQEYNKISNLLDEVMRMLNRIINKSI
ncbi:MAG: four helix bundle protein [Candidatus Spechtbacterales bacterium]